MTTTRLPMTEGQKARLIKALEGNWHEETEGAATYRALAERESDSSRREILMEMAESETAHAKRWAGRLSELDTPEPVYKGDANGRADSFANRVGGPNAALRRIELEERQDIARYGRQIKELSDEPSIEILRDLIQEEQRHSKTLKSLVLPATTRPPGLIGKQARDPQTALDALREKRGRRSPASWIGDAIYGVNDGLGAIFGIVSGVSGATLGNSHFVLLAGLAGTVASALSMGSGAYLASKSEREIYEAELHRKRQELEADPEGGREELALIYQVKGVPEEDARKLTEHLSRDPEQFLRTLAAEDLNLTEDALSKPLVSALSGAVSTAIGGFIPLIPFFFLSGYPAVIGAAIISLLAHFAVGAAKTMITVRSWWSSGLEMTLVGAGEGIVTYVIGIGLGHLGT